MKARVSKLGSTIPPSRKPHDGTNIFNDGIPILSNLNTHSHASHEAVIPVTAACHNGTDASMISVHP